jgi:hypothetical protein
MPGRSAAAHRGPRPRSHSPARSLPGARYDSPLPGERVRVRASVLLTDLQESLFADTPAHLLRGEGDQTPSWHSMLNTLRCATCLRRTFSRPRIHAADPWNELRLPFGAVTLSIAEETVDGIQVSAGAGLHHIGARALAGHEFAVAEIHFYRDFAERVLSLAHRAQ